MHISLLSNSWAGSCLGRFGPPNVSNVSFSVQYSLGNLCRVIAKRCVRSFPFTFPIHVRVWIFRQINERSAKCSLSIACLCLALTGRLKHVDYTSKSEWGWVGETNGHFWEAKHQTSVHCPVVPSIFIECLQYSQVSLQVQNILQEGWSLLDLAKVPGKSYLYECLFSRILWVLAPNSESFWRRSCRSFSGDRASSFLHFTCSAQHNNPQYIQGPYERVNNQPRVSKSNHPGHVSLARVSLGAETPSLRMTQ